MKSQLYFLAFLSALIMIASCSLDYKKTKSGLVYKIFHKGKSSDPLAKEGDWLKFNFTSKLNDSILYSSYGKLPGYAKVLQNNMPNYSPDEIFTLLRKGDSAVVVMSMDTLLKTGMAQQQFPTGKKGDKITLTFRVIDLFHNDSLTKVDYEKEFAKDQPRQQKEMEAQRVKMEKEMEIKKQEEAKEIESWLASKNIKVTKTPKGAYVQILSQGNGPQADSGKHVSVKYTGKNFKGKVFESNIDTSFHNNELLNFTVGEGLMIPGMEDAIKILKKGAHAVLYIPGALAYGPSARSEDIGPYENLIFEIYLVDVKDQPTTQQTTGEKKK